MSGAQFSTGTDPAAIDIIVESGMLHLAVQLIFVVLFASAGHRRSNCCANLCPYSLPMEGREFVVNQSSPKITQGIAPTLILIRVGLGVASMQNEPIRSGPPSSMSQPTSSTQVRINTFSFTEPGTFPQMSVSGIKSKPSNEDLGSAHSSMEKVAAVEVRFAMEANCVSGSYL
jgi:hypothetical protein